MNLANEKGRGEQYLYALYIKGEPEHILETGKKSFDQGMNPHYRIDVLRDLGPNIKIGILNGYNVASQDWIRLRKSNIGDDSLFKAKIESLGKLHYLYIRDLGVWKVDGLVVDKQSTTIQITHVELAK
jgi:hypothetical protein